MWKKLATIILVLALFSLFTITPAQAGDKQRHMWAGAGIALGTVALLGLLTHPYMAPPPPPPAPLNMFQATGKRFGNGFQESGRGSGFPVIMIAGEIGWQGTTRSAKPLANMWREWSGLKDVIDIINRAFGQGTKPCTSTNNFNNLTPKFHGANVVQKPFAPFFYPEGNHP